MAHPRRDPTQWGVRPGSMRLPYEEEHDGRFVRPTTPTDYALRLEAEVDRMIAAGELPCGPADESEPSIDIPRRRHQASPRAHLAYHIPRKYAKMSPSIVEEVTLSESAVAENAAAKPEEVKPKAVKPKAPSYKKKPLAESPRTRAKRKVREKVARATKRFARKAARRGKKSVLLREQTCVNIPIPAKRLLDAKCRKIGRSRNRIINELVAKFVGWKGLKKIAS